MVTHRRAHVALLLLVALALLAACDKVPLLAPTGSVISLIPEANNVALNSQMTIVATVIENGVASSGQRQRRQLVDDRRRHSGTERHRHHLYDDDRTH